MLEGIKDIYARGKQCYTKMRYINSYFILPIICAYSFLDLIVTMILLVIDSKKYLIPCVVLFLTIGVLFLADFIYLIFVRKDEVKKETERLNEFFASQLTDSPTFDYILPKDEGGIIPVKFAEGGLVIGGKNYGYDRIDCALFTSNYLNKVNLIMLFQIKRDETTADVHEDEEEKQLNSFSLPVDINLLSVMNLRKMKIINADVFAFIKDQTYIASKQILKYGKIQKNYDKYKK